MDSSALYALRTNFGNSTEKYQNSLFVNLLPYVTIQIDLCHKKRCRPLQAKLTVIWKYSNEYNVRNPNDEPDNVLKQFKWISRLIR